MSVSMISEKMKRFIEETGFAFVASANPRAQPHLAAGRGLTVPDPQHLVFEDWFCRKTMENIAEVPRLAVVVVDPATGLGYQFTGAVEKPQQSGILDGFTPNLDDQGIPQVQWRLAMRVEEITEFSAGSHSDHPIVAES